MFLHRNGTHQHNGSAILRDAPSNGLGLLRRRMVGYQNDLNGENCKNLVRAHRRTASTTETPDAAVDLDASSQQHADAAQSCLHSSAYFKSEMQHELDRNFLG